MSKKMVIHIFHADDGTLGVCAPLSERIRQIKDEKAVGLEVLVFGPTKEQTMKTLMAAMLAWTAGATVVAGSSPCCCGEGRRGGPRARHAGSQRGAGVRAGGVPDGKKAESGLAHSASR